MNKNLKESFKKLEKMNSQLTEEIEMERKLEKDQYIKERIADAIAAYKKEIGATSLRERAESSINTAAADQLNEKEGSE